MSQQVKDDPMSLFLILFNFVKIVINLNTNACISDENCHPKPFFIVKFFIHSEISEKFGAES